MNERDSPMRVADRTRGLDIILDLHGHHLGARQPYEYWRRRNADCDHRIAEARPQEGGERNGKNEKRARQNGIGDAPEQRIDEATHIAGNYAYRHADQKRDRDRDDTRQQRGPRTVNHARKHVASDIVGAEPMQRRRRLAHGTPSLQVRIVGRDQRRKQRQRDKKRDNEESERCSLAAQQSARPAGVSTPPSSAAPPSPVMSAASPIAQSRSRGLTRM